MGVVFYFLKFGSHVVRMVKKVKIDSYVYAYMHVSMHPQFL